MQQPHAAMMAGAWKEKGVRPAEALVLFEEWFHSVPEVAGVWANGASFDFPVYSSLADRAGRKKPWHYRIERDTRTLFWLAGGKPDIFDEQLTKHEALSDCIYQVKQVQAAVLNLRARNLEVPL
jgi:hypothetical protein